MDHNMRIALLVDLMREEGLSAILAFSSAAHHVDWSDAVALLAGIKPLGPSIALLESDGVTRLAVSPRWDLVRARSQARAEIVVSSDNVEETLDQFFGPSLRSGTVGLVDLHMMPEPFTRTVMKLLGSRAIDVSRMVSSACWQKTDAEIQNARIATQIAERTYAHLLEIARPGLPASVVAAELKVFSKQLGAEDNFMMFHAAPHPLAVQPVGARPFQSGDIVLAEITPSYGGQFTQVCRTLCLGEPTQVMRTKYELLATAMNSAIAKIRPNQLIREICLEIDEALRMAGYGKYCEPPYMNRRGHGLGITSVEPGNVALDNHARLKPGMFFVVHPNQYIPEVGYLLCGEPVLVTEEGGQTLTTKPAELAGVAY